MSLSIFLLLLVVNQWILPYPMAEAYNNSGVRELAQGNLAAARQSFLRASALNADRVVPYYNIGRAYEEAGSLNEAGEWYQRAIEEDANFAPAYRGLGQVYNEQSQYAAAEEVLIAGLAMSMDEVEEVTARITRYELLANLGWSYFAQGKTELAQQVLISALKMEAELKQIGEARDAEYRRALPHFYLAQIYEEAGDLPNAILQWEECLRFLDANDWRQQERHFIAQKHLQALTEK
jgi:tetratricopeptide (TPR) repeat protein